MEHAQSITNITIDLWQFVVGICSVLVLLGVMLIGGGKMLLNQIDKRFELRDESNQKDIEQLGLRTTQIERDLNQLIRDLPELYLRRDDWIRFSTTIDRKLDKLYENQSNIGVLVTQVSERVNAIAGACNK